MSEIPLAVLGPQAPAEFVELSAVLTGFSGADLLGTGVAHVYWDTLNEQAGEETAVRMLGVWKSIRDSVDRAEWEIAVRAKIVSDPVLGPATLNLIKMWYLGEWEFPFPRPAHIPSPEAYQQGLVWDAIGAHTQGAKQQGFGVWHLPPTAVGEE